MEQATTKRGEPRNRRLTYEEAKWCLGQLDDAWQDAEPAERPWERPDWDQRRSNTRKRPRKPRSTGPYKVLGVNNDCPEDELKAAYRQKAIETHPDHNQGDPDAAAKFRAVQEAYELITGTGRRNWWN